MHGRRSGSPLLDVKIRGLEGWDYVVTSEFTYEYNCIAHAADDHERWWWPVSSPDAYWPEGAPMDVSLDAFVKAYGILGYAPCEEDSFDSAYDKVAIYVDDGGKPTHAAKQLDDLYWSSKLGPYHDIKHPLKALELEYGRVAAFLRRTKARA